MSQLKIAVRGGVELRTVAILYRFAKILGNVPESCDTRIDVEICVGFWAAWPIRSACQRCETISTADMTSISLVLGDTGSWTGSPVFEPECYL